MSFREMRCSALGTITGSAIEGAIVPACYDSVLRQMLWHPLRSAMSCAVRRQTPRVRLIAFVLACTCAAVVPALALTDDRDPALTDTSDLARARMLYNERQFDQAIEAARLASD